MRSSFGPERVQIYTALSGEEGLDRFQKIHPDIVLCDIHLPGVDGFEVCRRMRKAHPRSAVILISAYDAENDYAIKAGEAGADSYLSKPLKKGELLFVVHFILRVAQLSQEVFEKNKQLEKALHQLKQFHQKLSGLNDELRSDKRRLSMNLQEMTELNLQLEEKNAQISSMMEEMGRRFDSTEGLLVRLIEMHQSDHRGHSERVAETAVYIGEKLNLT
ncbi:MAG: response regulator, partial [Nitrospinaceae bacterium]|nr:response regulator [Nitrospinaceae bacterium]NIS84439.1 response regulator [Nitrospinaceae bacterium]NIU95639.1 response regulator [Nitrospinaceae bacterium]NIW58288.1 response regulator [Nitrospinaceae bacterium]